MFRGTSLWVLGSMFAVALGCGGAASEVPAAVAPPVEARVEPVVEAAPDARIWDVYWDDIHSLRIFPQAGPIRSEEDPPGDPAFSGRSEHFAVVSFYFEKEAFFAPTISSATSLEDLLSRLAALPLVVVEEGVNPVYSDGQ